jgi:hypothetical protein
VTAVFKKRRGTILPLLAKVKMFFCAFSVLRIRNELPAFEFFSVHRKSEIQSLPDGKTPQIILCYDTTRTLTRWLFTKPQFDGEEP